MANSCWRNRQAIDIPAPLLILNAKMSPLNPPRRSLQEQADVRTILCKLFRSPHCVGRRHAGLCRRYGRGFPANRLGRRCGSRREYLQDPLGIDVKEPRLSWRLTAKDPAARGLHQSAYRILVSSSLQRLAHDDGDLWDSGDAASSESAHVVYAGKPLVSRESCFWKVRVRDQAGGLSAWSRPVLEHGPARSGGLGSQVDRHRGSPRAKEGLADSR